MHSLVGSSHHWMSLIFWSIYLLWSSTYYFNYKVLKNGLIGERWGAEITNIISNSIRSCRAEWHRFFVPKGYCKIIQHNLWKRSLLFLCCLCPLCQYWRIFRSDFSCFCTLKYRIFSVSWPWLWRRAFQGPDWLFGHNLGWLWWSGTVLAVSGWGVACRAESLISLWSRGGPGTSPYLSSCTRMRVSWWLWRTKNWLVGGTRTGQVGVLQL